MSRGRGRGGFGSQFTFNPELLGVSVHSSAKHRNPDAYVEGLAQPLPAYPVRQQPVLPLVRDSDTEYELASLKSLRLHFRLSKFHLAKTNVKSRSMTPSVERYSDKIRHEEKEDLSKNEEEDNNNVIKWELLPEELRPKKSSDNKRGKKRKLDSNKKRNIDVDAKLRALEASEKGNEGNKKSDDEEEEEEDKKEEEDKEEEVEDEDEEMDEGTDYANNYFDNGEGYNDDEDDNLDEGDTY